MIQASGRPDVLEAEARSDPHDWIPLVVASVLGIAFFAAAFGVRHFRVPWGDDTFFYVDAIRKAGASGLSDAHLGARPAFPLVAASLQAAMAASPWSSALTTSLAMGSGLALAGGALAARWRLRGWALGAFVALTSVCVVVTRLLAGKSENLMTLWLLAAAVTICAWTTGRRRVAVAAVMLTGAGLAEWPFLAAFIAVTVATLAWGWLVRRMGSRARDPAISREVMAIALAGLIAAAAAAVVVFAINGTAVSDAIQRLPPAFRYGPRLLSELDLIWPVPTAIALLLGCLAARNLGGNETKSSRRLLAVWLTLTVLVLVAGLAGLQLPTYRAITFALPVALALGAAPFFPARRSLRFQRLSRPVWRAALMTLIAGLVIVPSTLTWYRSLGPQTDPGELGQIATVGRYAEGVPGHGPTVLAVNVPDVVRIAFYERVVRAVLGDGADRVVVFAGRSGDALAGKPTLRGNADDDRLSLDLFEAVRPALRAGAPVVTTRDLDSPGFLRATRAGSPTFGPDVVILRGPHEPPRATDVLGAFAPLPPWWTLLLHAVAALVLLAASGVGWSGLALPDAPRAVRLALAPGFGAVSLMSLALVAVHAGLVPANRIGALPVGTIVVAMAIASSAGVAARKRWIRLRPGGS
ncbi:MAG: hypothetical protein H0W94_02340 [Actinobacteria bacterium]|nr:hypothetical protein [Actinomycetota bacterium]